MRRRGRKAESRKTHKVGGFTIVPAVEIVKDRAITFGRQSYVTRRRVKVWDVYRGPFRVGRCHYLADARQLAKDIEQEGAG
jgi:hypothetical protein